MQVKGKALHQGRILNIINCIIYKDKCKGAKAEKT